MQNHLSKPADLMLQNATALRKSAPSPPNSSDENVSCTAPATENASLQILFKCPTPAIVIYIITLCIIYFINTILFILYCIYNHFWQGAQSLEPATRTDIWTSKSAPTPYGFNILNSKCASCHNGVHFFDISTSKSGPELVCFLHFDFDMCFAPQRRALFRHLHFQECSDREVFLAFSLANVLRATNGVHFFDISISTSKSAPNVMCF